VLTNRPSGATRSRLLKAALAAVLAACLPACTANRDASADASRVIRIAFGIGPTSRASGVNVLTSLLYSEPLIAHESNGKPAPALAESWSWSDGGRLLTLHLEQGVKFHDGTPMTAPIVVDFLNSRRSVPPAQLPLGFERITDISAPDAATVQIRLARPDYFLLSELNELRLVHPQKPDVGTGPFRLIRRQPTVQATRFDEFHGGRSPSDAIEIQTYETHRAAWAALMRGEVDAAQEVSRESVEFMERSSQLKTYSSMQPYYIALVFNQRNPVLKDARVRRALSQALDRQAIVDKALRGHGAPAYNPIWPSYWAVESPAGPEPVDPAGAGSLLDAAGFPVGTHDSRGGAKSRFALRCLFLSEDPQYERIALLLQKRLFDIGVQLDLEPVTMSNLAALAGSGKFDTLLARANASRTLMFTYRFWRSAAADEPAFWRTGYTGADAALDRLRESQGDAETRAAVAEVARRFRDDVPAAFIAWTEVTRALTADIAVGEPNLHDPFTAIWRWARAPGGGSR
jgi:peptide/nickel transport system substrate-binding protein